MRPDGYEVEPIPYEGFPLTARVYRHGPDRCQFTFMSPEDAEYWLNGRGMVGGAARAYLAWHEQKEAEG